MSIIYSFIIPAIFIIIASIFYYKQRKVEKKSNLSNEIESLKFEIDATDDHNLLHGYRRVILALIREHGELRKLKMLHDLCSKKIKECTPKAYKMAKK